MSEPTIKVKLSREHQRRLDVLQPYKVEKGRIRINEEFAKVYGDPEKKQVKVGDKVEGQIDWERLKNDKPGYRSRYY